MSALTGDRLRLRRVKKTPEQLQLLRAKVRKELGVELAVVTKPADQARNTGSAGAGRSSST